MEWEEKKYIKITLWTNLSVLRHPQFHQTNWVLSVRNQNNLLRLMKNIGNMQHHKNFSNFEKKMHYFTVVYQQV